MRDSAHREARSRLRVLLLLGATIIFGLGSRSDVVTLPRFISQNAGDALWTCAVYLTLVLMRPSTRAVHLLSAAVFISFAVEISQLWRPQWLETLRDSLVGRLLLGRGWLWLDLVRYLVGAWAIYLLDRSGLLHNSRSETT